MFYLSIYFFKYCYKNLILTSNTHKIKGKHTYSHTNINQIIILSKVVKYNYGNNHNIVIDNNYKRRLLKKKYGQKKKNENILNIEFSFK